MFYLIGLGLDLKSISLEALEIARKSEKIYIENYTVEFPYNIQELEKVIGKRIIPLTRIMVENENFVEEARKKDIVLLVYGSPLTATTHISLILKCKQEKIACKILNNASIFDAVAETGLQVYKFGKTTSMPKWEEKHKPKSFVDIIKFNQLIKAHTLILVDLNLSYGDALKQLQESCRKKVKLDRIIVCSKLGTEKGRIYYDFLPELYGKEVYAPFCFIIPSSLHFLEQEALELIREKV
jgi:diphthine synthase